MNNTTEFNSTTVNPLENIGVQILVYLVYVVIFVIGMFGNILTCYVVFANRTLQTVTNFFITNLALADILLCALSVPITPLFLITHKWYFGSFLCHALPYSQGASVYVSTLTLTSIAIDRFIVIIFPFTPRMNTRTCFFIIVLIWIVSVLLTLPYGINVEMTDDVCHESWGDNLKHTFGIATFIIQFVIPFIIMTFCYSKISLRLNSRARYKPGARSMEKERIEIEKKKRTNRMLIAVVLVFGFCWLPFSTYNLINDFVLSLHDWHYVDILFIISHSTAMSSTCYNPFLYAWLNENFRKDFRRVLPFLKIFETTPPSKKYKGSEVTQDSVLPSNIVLLENGTKEARNNVGCTEPINSKVSYNSQKQEVMVQFNDEKSLEKETDLTMEKADTKLIVTRCGEYL